MLKLCFIIPFEFSIKSRPCMILLAGPSSLLVPLIRLRLVGPNPSHSRTRVGHHHQSLKLRQTKKEQAGVGPSSVHQIFTVHCIPSHLVLAVDFITDTSMVDT